MGDISLDNSQITLNKYKNLQYMATVKYSLLLIYGLRIVHVLLIEGLLGHFDLAWLLSRKSGATVNSVRLDTP